MKIIDLHCDVLYKLQLAKRGKYGKVRQLNSKDANELDVNMDRLQAGKVKVQFFAIFVSDTIPHDEKWQHALEQIDLFYTEILGRNPHVKHIKNWKDLDRLGEDEIGAVLTLEGADVFGNDLVKLRHLYRVGVLSIGLTWNYANLCADGVGERRNGGLTLLGKEVVRLNNEHKVLTDVSHAGIQSFWDMIELADYPIASHSNARTICNHPRNLYDDQIKGLFAKGGMIHLVFYPPFIKKDRQTASISDLIKHLDHLCLLGGRKLIGFGSDFDGIDRHVDQLETAGDYQNLINELLKHYSEDEVRGFAYGNFLKNHPS